MKQYIFYSDHAKQKLISEIPKDKVKIGKLWDKAILNYKESKVSIGEKKIEYNDKQRKYRNRMMNIALENYHSKDPKNKKRNGNVSKSFTEFWDFLHWWLKDVSTDAADMWNEMENYFHKTNDENKNLLKTKNGNIK